MTDLEFIKEIEKELKIRLVELDKIEWNSKGYISEDGKITGLSLYECEITQLAPMIPWLKSLANLTVLNLNANSINDISLLRDLTNLTNLNLSWNQLGDITPLQELRNLKQLYLATNQINDISALQALMNLTELYAGQNRIKDIHPLQGLTALKILDLSSNQITEIVPLKELKNLKKVNLTNNSIEKLPTWISDFHLEIRDGGKQGISFYNNPLKSPPLEIVNQGKKAIKNYFEQLRDQEEDYLFEAKMLIIGEPGAGKTTLAWKLEKPDCALPREDDTTKGIEVKQYYFSLQKDSFSAFKHPEKLANRKFRLNLWDFGGQEIYKATHRFFLSRSSLYALVADSRNENTDFNYWLNIVEMFGGDSPLLIVLNEKHQRKRRIDIQAMRKRFANIAEVLEIDFAESDPARLRKLELAVRYYVAKLPHFGSPVPAKWVGVREAIENNVSNTITLQDYLDICRKNGISKRDDALVLSQYFHDIGVFLHFQDDALLRNTIFLKPNWATRAVYKVLDHALLNQNNGRFNRADTQNIWSDSMYEAVRDELLRLMQKFFLTYEIETSGEYIVPERLPEVQPDYEWNERGNLRLRYEYDYFMPKGIISQFMVQMNPYIRDHNLVWRKGVVLEWDNTVAEVIEAYEARTIQIRLTGKHRRDFMTIITEKLDRINTQYEKMKVEKLIPCNCSPCKVDTNPYFYKYKDLKRRLEKGIQEVQCENSFKMVNVRSMIDEVFEEKTENGDSPEVIPVQVGRPVENVKRNKVFVSYSHQDQEWLTRVQVHLNVLKNFGIEVNLWDDTQIKSGMKRQDEIEKALAAAKVAILLVSTDFLASGFISDNELSKLLKAAENDGATILPVILKPCLYKMHPQLKEFQAVNALNKPLTKMAEDEREETLVTLAQRVVDLLGENT
jgi:Leucine-rich repeat (LRR) protein